MPLVVETPFGFSLDMSFWQSLLALPPNELILALFAIVGWAVLWLIFFYMASKLWVEYRQKKYIAKWKWVVLAVDIPAQFVQTPKAVEQIFAHISGALGSANIGQKYWLGKKQKWFSFEIVSLEGYIQFLIRTEAEYRDLVEASIYAQYANAEITEVEDYVRAIPSLYPNEEYDMHGVEFALAEADAYPIRTYTDFEQTVNINKEVVFSDPMAAVLENLTRIGHGENFWFQIIIEPTSNHWKEKGIELVKKIVVGKEERHDSVFSKLGGLPQILMKALFEIWAWNFEEEEEKEKEKVAKVSDLTPGMRGVVENVEAKISKLGFKSKIRALYTARREKFLPSRCMEGFAGALNQFHIVNSNALVPHSSTKTFYAFKDYRLGLKKTKFMAAYKKRKAKTGANPYILNIEELATLWHFPMPFVKTPLVQKASIKRGEPPVDLPMEIQNPFKKKEVLPPAPPAPVVPPPPEELPYA
ncbi:MAG: hypothetical protein AAB678_00870 [Patescibacteria group bacterium]